MRNLLIGVIVVLGLAAVLAVAGVSEAQAATVKAGPFEGVFHGMVYAPDGSKAPMSLELTHRGSIVEGTVFLGKGLTIDAGMCGAGAIPSGSISAAGKTLAGSPDKLSAVSTFEVSGIAVKVNLDSQIVGDEITARAKIDLPWLCGGDPVLSGKLLRA